MSNRHLLILILINLIFGLNFIAGKAGTETLGPLMFSTTRFVIVLVLLSPFLRIVQGQMRLILAIGLCLGVGHYAFMFYGIHLAGSLSSVAIASQLTVPFASIMAIIFLGESIGPTRAFAIIASFAGVTIIGFEPFGREHILALGMTAIASLAMAGATILMRKLENVGVFNLQAWIALVAFACLGLLTLLIEPPDWQTLQQLPLKAYLPAAYSAIGATIVGHGLLYYLLQRYPVNSVAPFIPLTTLFAILFGVALLDDQVTLRILLGGVLTLAGVTVIAIRNAKHKTLNR